MIEPADELVRSICPEVISDQQDYVIFSLHTIMSAMERESSLLRWPGIPRSCDFGHAMPEHAAFGIAY